MILKLHDGRYSDKTILKVLSKYPLTDENKKVVLSAIHFLERVLRSIDKRVTSVATRVYIQKRKVKIILHRADSSSPHPDTINKIKKYVLHTFYDGEIARNISIARLDLYTTLSKRIGFIYLHDFNSALEQLSDKIKSYSFENILYYTSVKNKQQ